MIVRVQTELEFAATKPYANPELMPWNILIPLKRKMKVLETNLNLMNEK